MLIITETVFTFPIDAFLCQMLMSRNLTFGNVLGK
jgi:hypothetical protein